MHFDVPTSWRPSLLATLARQMRSGASLQIYGALPEVFPTGRPDDVPRVDRRSAVDHFRQARQLGIETNYLLNGVKGARHFAQYPQIHEYLDWVVRCLCPDVITVSDPDLQRILHIEFGWRAFCISTICGIKDNHGLDRWLDVVKSCGTVQSVVLHHDMTQAAPDTIKEIAAANRERGIRTKLMLTESCYGGCRLRRAHYAFFGQPAESRSQVDPYQVSCIMKRLLDPASLLDLAGFITPEQLHTDFVGYGVDGFKITGRSCSDDWIQRTCGHYFSGRSPQNLFEIVVFTSPLLRESIGISLDELFYLDSNAYSRHVITTRGIAEDQRSTFRQESAARLFHSNLLRINDPDARYMIRNGRFKVENPGQYLRTLQHALTYNEGTERTSTKANFVTGMVGELAARPASPSPGHGQLMTHTHRPAY